MLTTPTPTATSTPASPRRTPLRSRSPLSRMPSIQRLVTVLPLTLSAAAPLTSPGTPSLSASTTDTDLHSSPDLPGRKTPSLASASPLQLPDALLNSPISPIPTALADLPAPNKVQDLMRRMSRGAANRLVRRRQSSNSIASRDHSSGPVILRRRSGSRPEPGQELDPLHVSHEEAEEAELAEQATVLHGPFPPATAIASASAGLNGPASPLITRHGQRPQLVNAPVTPDSLRRGSMLTKVTRKKRKTLLFTLDPLSARVSWNASNASKRFYLDDVHQIRLQADARNYREEFQVPAEWESRWFTIVYADQDRTKGRPLKTMHLVAPNQHMFELWTSTLRDISRYRQDIMAGLAGPGQDERTLQAHWKREMAKLFMHSPPASAAFERLDLAGVETLCRSLHITCSKNLLRAQFERADVNGVGSLSFDHFRDFVRRLKEREELKDIYKSLAAKNGNGLDLQAFLDFLHSSQGIDARANLTHWQKVFHTAVCKASTKAGTAPASAATDDAALYMSLDAFSSFLSSPANAALAPLNRDVVFDRPLNEYFISSSHNTYLLGRQLAGSSSTEAYIRALQQACRCVEIDCWDGPNNLPIVLHGRTMTSSVLFSDCISVIGRYAFEASDYPLILSLEVHCNAIQQQAMVDIMIRELGDQLLQDPLPRHDPLKLPCPEDLRRRILVKVKAGEAPVQKLTRERNGELVVNRQRNGELVSTRQRSFSSPFTRPQGLDNASIPVLPPLSNPPSTITDFAIATSARASTWDSLRVNTAIGSSSGAEDSMRTSMHSTQTSTTANSIHSATEDSTRLPILPTTPAASINSTTEDSTRVSMQTSATINTSMSSATEDSDAPPTASATDLHKRRQRRHKSKIIKSLGDLGVYTRGIKYQDFAYPESRTPAHVYSLAERTFEALCRDAEMRQALEQHNIGHLMRVYPSAFRMRSTNFDPIAFWRRGVQMVALNWQTYDLGMQLNEAMFAAGSDANGFVLKPAELRQPSVCVPQRQLLRFSIEIISAQQLHRPRGSSPDYIPSPYVEMEVFSAEDKNAVLIAEGANGPSNATIATTPASPAIGPPLLRRRSDIVAHNGYNPVFRNTFKLALETAMPELVFVRWSVCNSPDGRTYAGSSASAEPLASYTAKLSRLEQGYRHLPLYDHNGDQFLFSTLFVRIVKEAPQALDREVVSGAASISASTASGDRAGGERVGGMLRQFGQAVLKRTLSVDRRRARPEPSRSEP